MNKSRREQKNTGISAADLYAMKVSDLWAALKEEHAVFWMLCLYFFFEYVRPQSVYPILDILPWSQIALLSTLALVFFDRSVSWVSSPVNILFILFNLMIIVSGIFAFIPEISWDYRNVILTWFLVYFLTIAIVNTEKRLILFLVAYLLFNLKMSQHGAIGWASRGFSFASWGLIGSPGWFRNSGEFAIQMLIFGSLASALVYSLKEYWGSYKKWFFYIMAATGYMAVMGASSRGAQIALAIMGIWLLFRKGVGFKGLVILAIVVGFLFAILPDEQLQRFQEMGEDKNSLQRLVYWQVGLDIIKENPFTGIGYHNWIAYLHFLYPEGVGPLETIEEQHNIYIEAASDLGVFGLIIFILMVLYAFIINSRTRRLAKKQDNILFINLSYGLDVGLIGYLVAGSFVTVLFYPFFWIQLTMIVMLNNVAKQAIVNE